MSETCQKCGTARRCQGQCVKCACRLLEAARARAAKLGTAATNLSFECLLAGATA